MPRLPIPQGLSLTLRITQYGQEALVVLGARHSGGWVGGTPEAVAWRDHAWTTLRPLVPTALTLAGASMRYATGAEADPYEVGPPATNAGGGGGTALDMPAACVLLKWYATPGGRSGHGRSFLPGVPTTALAANGREYSSTFRTTATTAINSYLSGFNTGALVGMTPAVLSYTKGQARDITSGALATIVGVQRRRMRA